MRNHGARNIMEEKEWQNVQNVQPKSQSRRRLGKWLDAQTNREKECNLKSGYMNAQNATPPSAKCWAKRRSKPAQRLPVKAKLPRSIVTITLSTPHFSFFKSVKFYNVGRSMNKNTSPIVGRHCFDCTPQKTLEEWVFPNRCRHWRDCFSSFRVLVLFTGISEHSNSRSSSNKWQHVHPVWWLVWRVESSLRQDITRRGLSDCPRGKPWGP